MAIAIILLLTAAQGTFAFRRARDRELERREALAAVAEQRDAMPRERAVHQHAAIGDSPPDWLDGAEAKRTDAAPLTVDR